MNRDGIIRMAREACDQAPHEDWNSTAWVFGDETLERFAALVAAAARAEENEACAKVCEAADKSTHPADLADAIRARGNT